jgi:ribosomal protein S1
VFDGCRCSVDRSSPAFFPRDIMKPKPFETPAPFKPGQRRIGRVYRVGLKHVHLDIDGATGVAAEMDLALPSETTVADNFKVGDRIPVRVMERHSVVEVECADPDAGPWRQFAKGHSAGDEMTGRVHTQRDRGLLVELAPGVIGFLKLDAELRRGFDARDFLCTFRPGEPIRVRIEFLDARMRRCGLLLTERDERRWIGAARHASHWP